MATTTIRIASGLYASHTNAKCYSIQETIEQLSLRTNCYELLNDETNRLYLDIDGKVQESISLEDFNAIDKETIESFNDQLENYEHSIMTASSYNHKKISWRIVLTKIAMTKQDNKLFAQQLPIILPHGVKIDTGVYGNNQKMRMLHSNKDKENRPLRLIKGDPIDTLISYIPEGIETKKLQKPQKESNKSKVKTANKEIKQVLDKLPLKYIDDYDSWLTIGIVLFNEDEDVSLWDEVSKQSFKYKPGACEEKWKSFHKGDMTIATLKGWLVDEEQAVYNQHKTEFEKTHFKLNDPPMFVRIIDGNVKLIKPVDLSHIYKNYFLGKELFIDKWTKDPSIRTYEKLVFSPKKEPPANCFNIFTEFDCKAVKGDITLPQTILGLISNHDPKVMEYIEKWVAHIIQKPYEKPCTAIIIKGEQGAGKDTYFDFIGKILGEYFMNTDRPEDTVFCKFNGHLKKVMLVKFEEASLLFSSKKVEASCKSLITCNTVMYEDKGAGIVNLDNFIRMAMTTNKEIPIVIEYSDRRFMLSKASDERIPTHPTKGKENMEWWAVTQKELYKQETLSAYFYHLLNLDISDFNPANRPITAYYEEVKQAFIPLTARFFQQYIEEYDGVVNVSWKSRDLFNAMKEKSKFDLTETAFGRDMKQYIEGIDAPMKKVESRTANVYKTNLDELRKFLEKKKWWINY